MYRFDVFSAKRTNQLDSCTHRERECVLIKKEAWKIKQTTRQSNTAHSTFPKKNELVLEPNPLHSRQSTELPIIARHMYMPRVCSVNTH